MLSLGQQQIAVVAMHLCPAHLGKTLDPIWMPHDWPCTKLERACIRFLVRTKPLSHLFTISVVSPTTILCCCATSCRCYCCVVGIRVWISIARSCPRLLVAHNLPSLRLDKNTQSIGGVKFYAAVLSKPIKFTLLDKLHVIDELIAAQMMESL